MFILKNKCFKININFNTNISQYKYITNYFTKQSNPFSHNNKFQYPIIKQNDNIKRKNVSFYYNQNAFFSKKFAKVKSSKIDQINITKAASHEESVDPNVYIKPKSTGDKKNDRTALGDLNKMDERMVIQYYFELRNIMMDYYKGPNFKLVYFILHAATSYVVINDLLQFYWIYQTYFASSMIGISYLNYEFYSTVKEKKFIDRFVFIW
jgi:hypothetical protein